MKGDPRFGAAGQKKAGDHGSGSKKPHFGTQGQPSGSQNTPCKPSMGAQGQHKAGGTGSTKSKPDRR